MTTTEVRVFVNEQGVTLASGTPALEAVRRLFPQEADAIDAGQRRLTDSRGLPIDAATPVYGGAIYRVVSVRERLTDAGDDA